MATVDSSSGARRTGGSGLPRVLAARARWVVPGVGCLIAATALAQLIPWVVKGAVDAIAAAAAAGQRTLPIAGHVALLATLAAGQAAIRIASRVLIFSAGRDAEYELRRALHARLCRAGEELQRERGLRSGDLMSRLTADLSSVRALLGAGVLHVVGTVCAYAVALPMMLGIDALLTLYALAPYALLLLAARSFARGIYGRSADSQVALAALSSAVQEDLASVRELRGYGADGWRHQLLGELSMSYTAHALGLARWRSALIPVVGAGTGASLLTVLWAGGRGVIAGALSIGELVAFTLYVGLLAWPTMSIGWTMSLWQRGLAAWTRLREVLDARSWDEARPAGGAAVSAATAPAIEVRGLSLAEGGARILDDVALEVPAGGLCAIVGRVGSGKSTLVEAIAGLRAVPPGSLWIDGREAGELDVAARRRLVAYAPQSAFLFSATIRENIGWGIDGDAGAGDADARIERAARAAGLEADLAQLPDGLDTLVGERGLTLSGGQRQRIALARALVSERPLLILDDSLSSVDAETERAILAGIDAELAGRTALLVSHRLSALQHARQVIVLERGRVVERGAPRELLERGGLYAQLYRGQQLEEAIRG